MESIGERVKHLRQEQGIGYKAFVKLTGLPSQTIIGIESGKSTPQGRTAMIIADALGCTMDYIYTGRTCKDCSWYNKDEEFCRNLEVTMYDMDFCSYFDWEEDTE